MKKITRIFLVAFILNIFIFKTNIVAEENEKSKQSSILIEQSTGQVLYQNNASEKVQAASLNKLMSMLLWAEDIKSGKYSLDDMVTASINAENTKGSSIWLVSGDTVSVKEILMSVTIASANDATVALAEFSAGSESEFVNRMNARASELGMNNTSFKNSTGISAEGQYTTAHDIAIVTKELFNHDIYNEFYLIQLEYIREGKAQLVNTNRMIRKYKGIIGGKYGEDEKSGSCISVGAKKNDMNLIAVVLGADDYDKAEEEATNLLNKGFEEFEIFKPVIDTSKLVNVRVKRGTKNSVGIMVSGTVFSIVPKSREEDIEYKYSITDELKAPIKKGQQAGTLRAYLGDEIIFQSPIVCSEDIEEMNFFKSLTLLLKSLFYV